MRRRSPNDTPSERRDGSPEASGRNYGKEAGEATMRSEPVHVNKARRRGRPIGLRGMASASAGSLLVLAGLGAVVVAPGVAGGVNNDPPGNPTSPAVSY